jgi:hypothetical protein
MTFVTLINKQAGLHLFTILPTICYFEVFFSQNFVLWFCYMSKFVRLTGRFFFVILFNNYYRAKVSIYKYIWFIFIWFSKDYETK